MVLKNVVCGTVVKTRKEVKRPTRTARPGSTATLPSLSDITHDVGCIKQGFGGNPGQEDKLG